VCRFQGWGAELLGALPEVRRPVARLEQLDEWVWQWARAVVAQLRASPLAVRWPEHAPALLLPVQMGRLAEAWAEHSLPVQPQAAARGLVLRASAPRVALPQERR
jgi:hypothetical protein